MGSPIRKVELSNHVTIYTGEGPPPDSKIDAQCGRGSLYIDGIDATLYIRADEWVIVQTGPDSHGIYITFHSRVAPAAPGSSYDVGATAYLYNFPLSNYLTSYNSNGLSMDSTGQITIPYDGLYLMVTSGYGALSSAQIVSTGCWVTGVGGIGSLSYANLSTYTSDNDGILSNSTFGGSICAYFRASQKIKPSWYLQGGSGITLNGITSVSKIG